MSNKEVEFFGSNLWSCKDHLTENLLGLSLFYFQDEYGLSTIRLKMGIYNYKKRLDCHIYLEHKDVCEYTNNATNCIERLRKKLEEDKEYSGTFSFTTNAKIKVKTILLKKAEYDNKFMASIVFSDRETGLTDNDRVYVSVAHFISFADVMKQFKDNYLVSVNCALDRMCMKQLMDKIDVINNKFTNYTAGIMGRLKLLEESEKQQATEKNIFSVEVDQKEIDDHIKQTSDSIILGCEEKFEELRKREDPTKKDQPPSQYLEDFFTTRVLGGNAKKLETILLNCILDEMPIISFLKIISSKLDIPQDKYIEKFFPGCDQKHLYGLVYLSSRYIKCMLKEHLEFKNPVPKTVMPMYINCNNFDTFNITLMYELLVYFTFYSHLKTQLQVKISNSTDNKSLINFILKALLSPLVFYYMNKGATKEIIKSEVMSRYKKYMDNKVFEEVMNETHRYGKSWDISEQSIGVSISDILDKVIPNLGEFELNNVKHKFNVSKVPLEFIFESNNLETVRKILNIELALTKANVDKTILKEKKNTEGISNDVLNIFGLGERIINKNNLIEFIKEDMKNSSYLNIALNISQLINKSYKDLADKNCEFINLNDDTLKAFILWDVERDEKIEQDYNYFKNKIKDCTLDKTMCLSMLSNISKQEPSDFSNSLTLTR
jgi:hypothetical protein